MMPPKVKIIIFALLVLAIAAIIVVYKNSSRPETPFPEDEQIVKGGPMKISSTAFEHNQTIPPQYTCDGKNVSPPLSISNVSDGAKTLVLIVDDPDAPMGTWVHWTVWNIAPGTESIAEDSVPAGAVQGKTDFGSPGYGGPCPPSGTHRYFFKLYALDIILDFDSTATKKDIETAMEGHIVDRAQLIGLYKRQ